MRRVCFVVLCVVVLAISFFGVPPAPVYAASQGCNAVNGFSYTGNFGHTFETYQFAAGDTLIYTLTWSYPGVTVTSAAAYIELDSTVVASAVVADPTAPVTVSYTFPADQSTAVRLSWATVSSGLPSSWSISMSLSCPGADSPVAGPPIPSGFVLKTITCDVPVYDTPGGKPVGSNAITAGQTWYVNPTPVKDAAGKSWTEIFVAGYTNGYVPTSCVH